MGTLQRSLWTMLICELTKCLVKSFGIHTTVVTLIFYYLHQGVLLQRPSHCAITIHTFITSEADLCYVLRRVLQLKKPCRDGSVKWVLAFWKSIFLRPYVPGALAFMGLLLFTFFPFDPNQPGSTCIKHPLFPVLILILSPLKLGKMLWQIRTQNLHILFYFSFIVLSKLSQICQPFWYTV